MAASLTSEVFKQLGWQSVVSDVSSQHLHDFTARFRNRARIAASAGDEIAERAFEGLADLCSLHLRLDTPEEPFGPSVITPAFHSPGLDDLEPDILNTCGDLAQEADHLLLRARLADVAWVGTRRYQSAELAIDSYLELAVAVDPDNWPEHYHHIERALQLAAGLGRGRERLRLARKPVEDALTRHAHSDAGFFSAKFIELLHKYGTAPIGAAEIAERSAEKARESGAFYRARVYWELVATLAERAKDRPARRKALLAVVEAYVAEADEVLHQPVSGRFVAAEHLQSAITILRRIGDERARVDDLLKRLTDIQQGATEEIPVFSHSFSIEDSVKAATAAVAGKSLRDALILLSAAQFIPSVKWLRKRTEENAREFGLLSLFPKVRLSADGKVVARQGSVSSSDPAEREAAIRAEMFEYAARYREITAQASIEPMRHCILHEHRLRVQDLLPFLRHNPLVAEGREMLFAEGLHAGFHWDFPKAVHILVPQLEHSIRGLLDGAGVRVSGLDQFGTQEEMNLNRLLYKPELRELIGDDLLFALQGVFVEKFGTDIRNAMVHGLMSYGAFFSPHAIYAWWLILRVVMLPVLTSASPDAEELGDDPAGSGDSEQRDASSGMGDHI